MCEHMLMPVFLAVSLFCHGIVSAGWPMSNRHTLSDQSSSSRGKMDNTTRNHRPIKHNLTASYPSPTSTSRTHTDLFCP